MNHLGVKHCGKACLEVLWLPVRALETGELPRGTAVSGKSPRDRIGLSGSAMASGMISGGKGVVSRCSGAAGSTVVSYGGSVISSKALREVLAEGDVR